MRIARKLLALGVIAFAVTSVHAEGSYLGFGLGLQFDLGSLGGTITKDGLDAGSPEMKAVKMPGGGAVPASVGKQELIVPENKLDVLAKTGIIKAHQGGAMTGGVFSIFYEKEWQNDFIRIGVDHTRKIMGGHTTAEFAMAKFMDITWSYQATQIPFYYGLKAGVGESASVYGALGLHYYRGGWGLEGDANGQIPYELTSGIPDFNPITIGPHSMGTLKTNTFGTDGLYPVIGEKIRFDVSGIGFNFLVGVERKLQNGNKTYFEIEYMVGAKMDNAPVQSIGTISQIAPTGSISYPINLSGTRFKFGYKMAM